VKSFNIKIIILNPHFWGVTFLTVLISFTYLAWPWRELQLEVGLWQWLPKALLSHLALWEAKNRIFGILYTIPIIYGALAFRWYVSIQWYVNIAILAFLGLCPIILGFNLGFQTYMQHTYMLLLPFAIALIIIFEAELRRRERDFLSQQERQHRIYTAEILKSDEQARQRLAQELHDETIQNFLAIASFARALESDAQEDTTKKHASLIRDVSLRSAEGIRRIVHALKPKILDDLGLVPALNWLVSSVNKDNGVKIKMFVDGTERILGNQEDLTIFRILQEALNNIKTHANATEAVINFEYLSDGISLNIRDNGKGFDTKTVMQCLSVTSKRGLIGIQERAELLGGKAEILSNIGEGTVVSIRLPT
jgi:two-component system, NarL family, sensor histidine kinase DegS